MRIFVGNIGTHCNESLLRSVFEAYGQVQDVTLSANYAFVVMGNQADADRAVRGLTDISWFLKVSAVTPPTAKIAA